MRIALAVVGLVSCLLVSNTTAQVGTTGTTGREEFTAIAVGGGGPLSGPVATNLDIVIEGWTTEREREQLLSAL